jgi:DNA-binding response OmpR family regulator
MSKKILAVDDDHDIVDVIKIILEDEGYEVSTLTNGRNILDIISLIRPDLILLDVMLGGMDGREICKSIKDHPIFKYIPVVMISASHNLQSVLKLPGSPNDFLSKPFDIDHLVNKVRTQLGATG